MLQEDAANDKISLEEYVFTRVSKYAAAADKNGNLAFNELIAELYNMSQGSEKEFAVSVFRRAGVRL